eukprot:4121684-Pleurochrysis_carterae.AAC.1
MEKLELEKKEKQRLRKEKRNNKKADKDGRNSVEIGSSECNTQLYTNDTAPIEDFDVSDSGHICD